MKIDLKELEFRFKFTENPDMPCTMILILGQIEIRGFTIRKSKLPIATGKAYVLYPPSNKVKGGHIWIKIFFITDKKEWNKLEDLVLEKFTEEYDEYLFKRSIQIYPSDL